MISDWRIIVKMVRRFLRACLIRVKANISFISHTV
jgi:hypothetical protein